LAIDTMPRTILCQKCGIVLNLPDRVTAGKKMKCPGCGHRFEVSEKDASSASTLPGPVDADTLSSRDFGRRPPSADDLPVSRADRDLRDLFDLPTGTAAQIERSAVAEGKPKISDAEALFREEPARKKKLTAAEARAQSRRCITCGGVVAPGTSICPSCGVDQETGMRVGLEDDLAPAPPRASFGPPIHIIVTGLLSGLAGVILLVFALIQSVRGGSGITQYGWLCLALVSAFGIYGAVQFYLGKSPKYLMLALTLGVFVDLVSLIALPIVQANFENQNMVVAHERQKDDPNALDEENVELKGVGERIDQQKIAMGLTVVVVYALLSIYLMSPPVKRHFARQAALASAPIF
jgi:hypothetical protein